MLCVLSALPLPELPCVDAHTDAHTDAESLLKKLHSGQATLFGVRKNQVLCRLISVEEMMEWLSLHHGEEGKKKKSF